MIRSGRPSAPTRSRWSRRHDARGEEGAVSALLLAVVLFLSAAAVGAMLVLNGSSRALARTSATVLARQSLEVAARSVVAELAADPTPDADSKFDPVWSSIAQSGSGSPKITLQDLSSRLNLNLMRTELFSSTGLGRLLSPGLSADELRQYRVDKGPFESLAGYADYIDPQALDADFTVYSYVNLNTTFEESLEQLFAARTGDAAAAAAFRSRIQEFLTRKELVKPEQLRELLGLYYPQLYPLMNVEPSINANFAPEEVLRAILSYPYGGHAVANWQGVLSVLLARRDQGEITASQLASLVPARNEQLLILQYLGVRTWFWSITASDAEARMTLVVARIPDETHNRFVVLEDHFVN